MNTLYIGLCVFVIIQLVIGQTTDDILLEFTKPRVFLNGAGGCEINFDFIFSKEFKDMTISNGFLNEKINLGNRYYVIAQFTRSVGQYVSFTVTDQNNIDHFYNWTAIECKKNPQVAYTGNYDIIYQCNRKLISDKQGVLALKLNSYYYGYIIQSDSNQLLHGGADYYYPQPKLLYPWVYNYPYNDTGGQYTIRTNMYSEVISFKLKVEIDENTVTVPTMISYTQYDNFNCFVIRVNNVGNNTKVLGKLSATLSTLQMNPVYGGFGQSITYIGQFYGLPTSVQQSLLGYIYATGNTASLLTDMSYTIPAKGTVPPPTTYKLIGNQNYSIPYIDFTVTIPNQQLFGIILVSRVLGNPLTYYFPYGLESGNWPLLNYEITNPTSKYGKTQVNSVSFGGIYTSTPYPVTVDSKPPTIQNIEYIELNGPSKVLIRIQASDDISGVASIRFGDSFSGEFTTLDLISGTILNGIYEKIFDLYAVTIDSIYTTDYAYNSGTFPPSVIFSYPKVPFDIYSVTSMYFEKNIIDISTKGVNNTLYFNYINADPTRLFGFKLISTLEIAVQMSNEVFPDLKSYDVMKWDPIKKMFKVDFYIPPRLFGGNLDYVIMANGEEYDTSTFSLLVGSNATLNVYTTIFADEMPPYIVNINSSPTNVNIVDQNQNITFDISVQDDINGIDSVNVTIVSDFDPIGQVYVNYFNGFVGPMQFQITKEIVATECVSQKFYIKDISTRDTSGHFTSSSYTPISPLNPTFISPFIYTTNYKSVYSIQVTCQNDINDYLGPEMTNFKLSRNVIDVSSMNRQLTIYFENNDTIGLHDNYTPYIYLENTLATTDLFKYKAALVTQSSTDTKKVYNTTLNIPYMFGYPDGFGVSVFGLVDKAYNFKGYPFGKLYENGINSIVSVNKQYSGPIIEDSDKYKTTPGSFAIYGRGFGSDENRVIVTINDNSVVTIYTASRFKIFSGIYIELDSIPKPVAQYFEVTVTGNGKVSNVWIVGTIGPTSSPIVPPKCPGSPVECSGNGVCIISGQQASCQCNQPWVGDDCSYQIFIVPKPTIDPTEPNSTIDFKPPTGEDIFYTTLVSIVSLREVQLDQTLQHEYKFKSWLYKDISTSESKVYQYLTNITHPVYNTNTLVNVSIEWFDEYHNITFADQTLQMTPSSIKYRIELSPYQFEKSTNTMDIQFLVSIASSDSDDSCSIQKQGVVFENDFINLELDNHSFYGRFIKRAIIDGRNTIITNSMEPLEQSNDLSSTIVSIHIPHFKRKAILDPDFSILINHAPVSSTEGSLCKSKEHLSKSQIAGIVIGCVAFVTIVVAAISYIIYKKTQHRKMMNNFNQKLQNMNNT
ncbi:EGF-like domain-containing protein [Tieghemostelium lacteum]|uniref:EGF-like domain-containing protein n=1 Tax=Tieghemostelium lacteum TaxID=361077 RepID=A0A151Z901_TIELA|nr:EGF-like domain-containing protein [Tieghemostelium lacteum]|eukprot:KYQ90334.1 EGF-like domain-containing protein [Tieghemostelium lacteum]